QPLDRVGVTAAEPLERALGPCQDAGEAALLDAVQQLFLAADVVVHPRERHPGGRGEVAHRRGVIALVGEHLRRPGEEVVQPLVVGAHGVRTVVRILKLEAGVGEFKGGGRRWRTGEGGGLRRQGYLHRLSPPFTALHRLNFSVSPTSTVPSMPPAEPVAAVPSPTDAALIAAWQGGDEQAAAELVRRHARALARFLAGAGAPEADLDDVVQETFIR